MYRELVAGEMSSKAMSNNAQITSMSLKQKWSSRNGILE